MHTTTARPVVPSPFGVDAESDLRAADPLAKLAVRDGVRFDARGGRRNLWIVAGLDGRDVVALRCGHGIDELTIPIARVSDDGGVTTFEFASALGAFRTKIAFPLDGSPLVRCTTSLLPSEDVGIPFWPRDLYVLDAPTGSVHTAQRGLRSGIVFASSAEPAACTLFYLQNFSSLTEYFEATKRSPADSVGGRWPELGYAPPAGEECVLPKSRELVVSDAFLTVVNGAPATDGEAAATLSRSARRHVPLPSAPARRRTTTGRAAQHERCATCASRRTARTCGDGRRFMMPYVGDEEKPPESMVQLTLAVNAGEYARWRGEPTRSGRRTRRYRAGVLRRRSRVDRALASRRRLRRLAGRSQHEPRRHGQLVPAPRAVQRVAARERRGCAGARPVRAFAAVRHARRAAVRLPLADLLSSAHARRHSRRGRTRTGRRVRRRRLVRAGDAARARAVRRLRVLGGGGARRDTAARPRLRAGLPAEHDRVRGRSGDAALEEDRAARVSRAERDLHGQSVRQHVAVAVRLRARPALPHLLRTLSAARRAVHRRVRGTRSAGEVPRVPGRSAARTCGPRSAC